MQRGLNMQGLMQQQQFDHHQRNYNDPRDILSSLTRQQNQGIQHQQGINLNQQQDSMYFANEYRRMQQTAQHQHSVHGMRHQQSPLAFLQEQHEVSYKSGFSSLYSHTKCVENFGPLTRRIPDYLRNLLDTKIIETETKGDAGRAF